MQRLEVFLNELSWENWCDNLGDEEVNAAFRELYACLKSIRDHKKKHGHLNVFVFTNTDKLLQFVSEVEDFLEDRFLLAAFRKLVFESVFVQDWKEKSVQNNGSNYYFLPDLKTANLNQLLNQTAIGEIAERKFLYATESSIAFLLVNLIRSKYGEDAVVQIIRENKPAKDELINLDFVETKAAFEEWIAPYLAAAGFLENAERFQKTSIRVQGKSVYKEHKTSYYWYFDNFHRDFANKEAKVLVELEVFDAQGKHIGTASALDGILNRENKVEGRKISIS